MKNLKPSQILLGGSLLVSFFTLIILIVLDLIDADLRFWHFVVVPVVLGIFSYAIFYLFVKISISDRLKLLYRTIRTGKITNSNQPYAFKLSDDIIGSVEDATKHWREEKQNEISRLKDQEEFRREFLGNLAHELKTPVFAIQGYVLTLLEGGLEDERVNRMFLERAEKACDRMVNILEDLDQITRLEVNELTIEFKTFDIVSLTNDIFESLEYKAVEKGIKLKFAKAYDKINVRGDKSKISQVLTNLINNSIIYGNQNGESTIRFYDVDDLITIEVSDNGPGISEENLPRLFERFYRVEKSRNRNEGGSGLGLAIAKHIIESHNQRISVRSTVDVGSTFSFTLEKGK